MAASRTKDTKTTASNVRKSVQLIVFAPVNADPEDEDSRIYMVCPASLKVVEVIEKFDDEALEYITLLGKHKRKTELAPEQLEEDLGKEFEGEIEVAGKAELGNEVKEILKEDDSIPKISEELDEDIVTFASGQLEDIFPGGEDEEEVIPDDDLVDAFSILDEEESEKDLMELEDFISADDGEELPEL